MRHIKTFSTLCKKFICLLLGGCTASHRGDLEETFLQSCHSNFVETSPPSPHTAARAAQRRWDTKISIFSYLLLCFLLFSCNENFFESTTIIEIPEHQPQMVLRANFSSPFGEEYGYYVRLSHTLGILDTTDIQEITDATITLLEEEQTIAVFEKVDESDYYFYSEGFVLSPHNTYTLQALSPTFGEVKVTQQLPSKVTIVDASYEENGAVDRYGERGDEINIQFQDPGGEQNYYRVHVSATVPFEGPDTSFVQDNWYGGSISPVDPLIDDLNSLYLTDASFDGEKYTTRISVQLIEAGWYTIEDATNLAPVKISVHLSSISKDRYLFEKTLFTYRENEDNPFAEPVVVHENIEGGSGIFTLSFTDEFSIEL